MPDWFKFSKPIRNFFYRAFPERFWGSYAASARNLGFDSIYIVLSFDCDTPQDAAASVGLFDWLKKRFIPATFAVPGAQLRESAEIYRGLWNRGATFINHGSAPHTVWRDGRFWSTTFYSRIAPSEVQADIREGHKIFVDVFGSPPKGFRAPHFGHFQDPDQLALIYRTLNEFGTYRYSSTTTATAILRHGIVHKQGGLIEIPTIGSFYWPLRIFDSWGYCEDKFARKVNDEYAADLFSTVEQLRDRKLPALLNYYADPAHIIDSQAYFDALDRLASQGTKFINFETVVDLLGDA